ncbi:hypothetical protein COV18_07365 [Candidatus Woesearchaeota archaeon CG10_big_fil_rev_8_21_14_0_10_37_12]|nr:MAG: hypothetical protein COV18_07365 [Candidatus Woesearchaeota archaeon CG10_big_fil_rev_8_21_14_0_10_37_12]
MVRHIYVSMLLIVAIVGFAAILFSYADLNSPTAFAVKFVPEWKEEKNAVMVELDLNEYIADDLEGVDGQHFSLLKGGLITTKIAQTRYTQALQFNELNIFNGGRAIYGRTESAQVGDFIRFTSDDAIFKYRISFSSGLESQIVTGRLDDLLDSKWRMLGEEFTLNFAEVNTADNYIRLDFFGRLGSIRFEDFDFTDSSYQNGGVKINDQPVDARVRIKANEVIGNSDSINDRLVIFSVEYILNTHSKNGGDIYLPPFKCVREYMLYPEGFLVPNFDICYEGMQGWPGSYPDLASDLDTSEIMTYTKFLLLRWILSMVTIIEILCLTSLTA